MDYQEYVPTVQDLQDFEESYNALKNINTPKKWTFTHCGQVKELSRETVCTLVSHLLANVFPEDAITSTNLHNRLTVLAMFGYNLKELTKIVCAELSDEELEMLMNGKSYPYLIAPLRAVVGEGNLEYCRFVYKNMLHTHVLPYKQFYDEPWYTNDKEKLQVRLELISLYDKELRPLWGCRARTLMELGIHDKVLSDSNNLEVDCVSYLKTMFELHRQFLSDFKSQFGLYTQYLSSTKRMKFSLPITFIPLMECYFNIKFINVPKSVRTRDVIDIVVPNWY